MTNETDPANDPRCPLCGRAPRTSMATHVGQVIGFVISLVVVALVLYWPIRWVLELYSGIAS